MINIPTNTYVQPTDVREEVVEKICKAFLAHNCWSIFHPFSESCYRTKTEYTNGRSLMSSDWTRDHTGYIKFNGEEMKRAFKELIAHGYHMFRVYEFGSWLGYVASEKPFLEGWRSYTEVREFNDRID